MSLPVRLRRWKLKVFGPAFFKKVAGAGQSPAKNAESFRRVRGSAPMLPSWWKPEPESPRRSCQRQPARDFPESEISDQVQTLCVLWAQRAFFGYNFMVSGWANPRPAAIGLGDSCSNIHQLGYIFAVPHRVSNNSDSFAGALPLASPEAFLKKSFTKKLQVSPSTMGCTCFPSSAIHSVSSSLEKSATKLVGFFVLLSCR